MTANITTPQRGANPRPDKGWPWSLTDYEVSYIRAFGVRPHREAWEADVSQVQNLDREAEYLLKNQMTGVSATALKDVNPKRRSAGMSVVVLTVASLVLLALSVAAVSLGIAMFAKQADASKELSQVEEAIDAFP